MSVERISTYRVRCDAPHCAVAHVGETDAIPEGWRTVRSTDHHQPDLSYAVGRRRLAQADAATARSSGWFALHLCPEDREAFDGHLPRTDGIQVRSGRDGAALVSCSCGAQLGRASTSYRMAGADVSGPGRYTEKAWWRHLPAELQQYAQRAEVA